ncbi:substrate-binding periplasmic protein [Undibacterium rugosum]|uniref:Transporter substrate-binding domain-containing protein n=1 Tax=Undibacterium rugosum TaxID=2762291 RepID=A0A923KYS3_9BURK|nr:transporter substrate-binding domain-containing protein [Undibacterium rugosum]MBC3934788.1 transporter substrate-binding domain-containing protein [Undibacterium rugosum]MBR7778362.1 transporter substrate-binding domain-containing protein [Undibacterium rugosum]
MKLSSYVACALLVSATAHAQTRACGGDSQWPPFSYQAAGGNEVQGISADLLRQIFPNPVIKLLPWLRCLTDMQAAKIDIAMSTLKSPERERIYLFSRPYSLLTPSYLYASQRFPSVPVTRLSDLTKFKVCALRGSFTSYSKLPASSIDSGASNYASLLKKLDIGRCDILIDMQEIFAGFAQLEILPFDSGRYRILPLPETSRIALHYAVSKIHPDGLKLIHQIDKRLEEMQQSGQLNRIVHKHMAVRQN